MKKTGAVVCLLGALSAGGVCAEGGIDTGKVIREPEVRTAPPYGPFYLFGGDVVKDKLKVGDEVSIQAAKKIYSFAGTHLWLDLLTADGDQVWAYAGVVEKPQSWTVVPSQPAEQ